jgi:predicted DNA-binding protein with PD1-like motif
MKILKSENQYILKIQVGEKIMESLKEFMRAEKLPSGSFTGIGATESCTIGYFDRTNREYLNKTVDIVCEITSLIGNLGWDQDGNPMIHCHITLGFPDYHIEGGHLVEGTVGVVCEICVIPNSERVIRRKDDTFGLMLMNL